MTENDYKTIVGVIREVALDFVFHDEDTSDEVRDALVSEFSSALLRDNPNFDIIKFRNAVYSKQVYRYDKKTGGWIWEKVENKNRKPKNNKEIEV